MSSLSLPHLFTDRRKTNIADLEILSRRNLHLFGPNRTRPLEPDYPHLPIGAEPQLLRVLRAGASEFRVEVTREWRLPTDVFDRTGSLQMEEPPSAGGPVVACPAQSNCGA